MSADEYRFEPNELRARAGAPIRIELRNTGDMPHNLTFAGIGAGTPTVEPGDHTELLLEPEKPGTYAFRCTVSNHARMGLRGRLIVEPADPARASQETEGTERSADRSAQARLVGALALITSPAYAHDDPDHGDVGYGPDQGEWEFLSSATGTNDNEFDAGEFGLAGALGHFLTDRAELGLRHNMVFFDSDDVDATYVATTRGFFDYHFDFDRLQPYLGVDLGIRYGENDIGARRTLSATRQVRRLPPRRTAGRRGSPRT